ncbi:MAG: glutathione S-transferase family protein [Proteobacteria bacterium]|nr:glutathione S-transferase family protein [Pseudomonadota bacterium]
MPENVPRLLTIRLSHYCEKARWALDRAGVAYREEAHLPLLSRLHTRRATGGTVPVLVTGAKAYADSSAVVRFAADRNPQAGLLPTGSGERQEVLELERYFDRELGPHARRWVYSELIGQARLLEACWTDGVPRAERLLAPLISAVCRPLIRRSYRVTPASGAASLQRAEAVLARVAERLADGRAYLVGTHFTLADLSFASLAAPLVLPPQYGGVAPRLEDVPASMRAQVLRLRESPAGAFALRLYRQERSSVAR